MTLNFSINFEEESVHIVYDDTITLVVRRDGFRYIYKNFDKVDDGAEAMMLKVMSINLLRLYVS